MVKKTAYSLGGILFIFATWLILYITVKNQVVIPSPLKTVKEALLLFTKGYFYSALFKTLLRVVIAFLISFILAVITAVLSCKFSAFAGVFNVVIAVLRSLPTLAILLVILVLSVSRTTAPIAVCFLTLFPLLHTGIYSAISAVSKEQIEMCKVYKVPFKKQVFNLYLPSVLPPLCLDVSSALSFGIKITVSAEILASVYGSIGGLMYEASIYSATMLFALALAVCIIGIIVEIIGKFAFEKAGKRLR